MQSVSSGIWTCVTVSISYDDNHYTTGTYRSTLLFLDTHFYTGVGKIPHFWKKYFLLYFLYVILTNYTFKLTAMFLFKKKKDNYFTFYKGGSLSHFNSI